MCWDRASPQRDPESREPQLTNRPSLQGPLKADSTFSAMVRETAWIVTLMITHRYPIPFFFWQLPGYLPDPSPCAEQNKHFCMIKFVMFYQVSDTQCYLSLTTILHKAVCILRVRVRGEQKDKNKTPWDWKHPPPEGPHFCISHRLNTLPR